MVVTKRCTTCGEQKPLASFHSDKRASDGRVSRCKACRKEQRKAYYDRTKDIVRVYNTEWRLENPEYYREYKRIWELENADLRARYRQNRRELVTNLPSEVTVADIERVLMKYDHACALTGQKLDRPALVIDHVIPYATGHVGDVKSNILPIADYLNTSKHDRNIFEWVKTRPDVDMGRFFRAMEDLAAQNGLTLDEYRDFVAWCHENRRTPAEIERDKRPSINIWREDIGLFNREAI